MMQFDTPPVNDTSIPFENIISACIFGVVVLAILIAYIAGRIDWKKVESNYSAPLPQVIAEVGYLVILIALNFVMFDISFKIYLALGDSELILWIAYIVLILGLEMVGVGKLLSRHWNDIKAEG